ncbi:MAG: hypothetical protein UV80_C0003G0007 [Candidatus Peregrinibacteria bacterium GW2011_GWF2_43_17]|nr:MAG: hypothetical protein UV80_C0003G0007 [Candidatus Peregrinibacteria bacterium GW2011_GWF2_43_17]KKT19933.1 MAG: hypothetical protein UW03_C0012G0002 [Candidatus Peregrinibacteria bacterium GW2011_GWA2_43_8]HAU40145.1 hypothetical protein [Candidatus Peregrinibacteria bacterium]
MDKRKIDNSDSAWELVKLIDELNFKKLEIMDEAKTKKSIWAKIEPHVRATACGDLKTVAEQVAVTEFSISPAMKAKIKEMVMDYVESVNVGVRVPFFKRFAIAGVLMVFAFFALYPKMPFFPSASAEKITYVEVEQGNVEITRDGKVHTITDDMLIEEGDVMKVADGALAQVYFFDDSRMAFAPGSEVSFGKLYMDENNGALTQVEVELLSGKAWVQVINLTGDSDYFSITASNGTFIIDRAADLNIEVLPASVAVYAVEYLADFEISSDVYYREGMLGEGAKLVYSGDDLIIEELPDMTDDVWWNYNLIKDEEHLDAVTNYYITQSAENVHLRSADPLYTFKKFQETVEKVVSFDSSENSMQVAGSRLAEAEQLISEGSSEEAQAKITEYLNIVEEVVESGTGAGEEVDLSVVEAQIDEITKALSVKVSDNSGLVAIQDAVNQAEESVSQTETEKSLVKVDNASNKLSTVLDLLDAGSYEDALSYLKSYQEEVYTVVTEDVSQVSSEERAYVVSEILSKKVSDLHLLKIIAGKLDDLSGVVDAELQAQVTDIKEQSLFEINTMVVSLKERAIDTISDFLAQVQADEGVQIQVLSNLKKTVPLDFDIIQKINDIEEVYFEEGSVVFLVNE